MIILEFYSSLAILCYMLHIVSGECKEYFNTTSGSIRFLGSDTNSDFECTYTIQTPRKPLLLTFKSFNLKPSPDCNEDYIEIQEDTAASGSRLCGNVLPKPIIIISGLLKMKYISHGHSQTTRFTAEFKECKECVEKISSNEGYLHGVIDLKDRRNLTDLIFLFEPPSGQNVRVDIASTEKNNNEDCKLRWIKVKNGTSYNSPVIASYCESSDTDSNIELSGQFTVTLHTRKSGDVKGFSASYKSINRNTDPSGVPMLPPMSVINVGSVKEKQNNGKTSPNTGVITAIGAVVFSMVVASVIVGLIVWRRRRETTISKSCEINGYGTLRGKNSKRANSKDGINVVYNEHYSHPSIMTKSDSVPCIVTNIDNIDCSTPSVITNAKDTKDGKGFFSNTTELKDKDFAIEEGVQYSISLTSERKSSVGSNNSSIGSCHNQQTEGRYTSYTDDCLFHGNDTSDNVFDSATLIISDNSMIA